MSSQITEEDIKSRGNTVTPNETPTDRAMDAANGDQSTDTTNNQESESFWVRWAGPHRSTEPSPEIPMPAQLMSNGLVALSMHSTRLAEMLRQAAQVQVHIKVRMSAQQIRDLFNVILANVAIDERSGTPESRRRLEVIIYYLQCIIAFQRNVNRSHRSLPEPSVATRTLVSLHCNNCHRDRPHERHLHGDRGEEFFTCGFCRTLFGSHN
ncbi:hypothetical protein QR680_002999 [Steinernema hermaphroditum]|uniref:Uncharacterized protein n=1 Tax=Steinernema hermaphroditum TaxID=289476 RepID=A0AA39LJ94_9BILA|nr:hypothetical protein QR680_002999 [Steinernema hermaphroditum]